MTKNATVPSAYQSEQADTNLLAAYQLLAEAKARLVAAYRATGDRRILDVASQLGNGQGNINDVLFPVQEVAK